MPGARAFHALRYTEKAGPLADLVAPPFDVMSAGERAKFAAKSPHNVVHLTLPEEGEADGGLPGTRYEHAARLLEDWLASGAVAVEEEPSMTVVRETFTVDGREYVRTGVELALRLDAYGEGEVYPHERTLEPPKVDRLALMRTTRANLSPTFALVPDEDGELRAAIADVTSREPDDTVSGPDAAERRVWYERDQSGLDRIAEAVAGRPAVIADGHHRYETALNYRDQLALAGNDPGEAAHVLCHVVPVEDPGLVILPTHRGVAPRAGLDEEDFLARLAGRFETEETTRERAIEFARGPGEGGTPRGFVVVVGRPPRLYLARLRDASGMDERAPGRPEAWRGLDVSCLHLLVIEDVLGITPGEVASGGSVSYSQDASAVIAAVERGGGFGFILRPTPPRAVAAVARAGEKMPQKSTYFYPKVAAGFAMRLLA